MKKITRRRIFIAASFGNILEFYDFSTYGLMMSVMAPLFFPATDPINSLLMACGVFSVSFIVRPLGGLIFGYIGDRYGGKTSFSFSLIFMALSTCLIGLLPIYEEVGILSPTLLIVCRIIQGLCLGGEFTGSLIYASEHINKKNSHPAFITGCITAAAVSGWFLSSLISYISITANLPFASWRLPFLLGAGVGLVGFYVRRSLPDSILNIPKNNFDAVSLIKSEIPTVFSIASIGVVMGALFYGFHIFPNSYLPTKFATITQSQALTYTGFGIGIYMLFLPVFGWASDKIGHLKFMSFFSTLTALFSTFILSWILSGDTNLILGAEFLASLILAGYMAPATYVMTQSFPTGFRYRLASLSYNLGASIVGGLTPGILVFLASKYPSIYIPGLFISVCGIAGILSSRYLKRKFASA